MIFEIISVGNELLIGKVTNSNASWLGEKITSLGGVVQRCTVVMDNVEEIVSAIKDVFTRRCDWVIISGGLGPTYDDKTLESLAKALEVKLSLNEDAVTMMKDRYNSLVEDGILQNAELTPHRLKMVTLPEGGTPLRNRVGSAPGVLVKKDNTRIICLPGVPSELKHIFEEHLEKLIKENSQNQFKKEVEFFIKGVPESDLAPLLEDVLSTWPSIYIKSHPKDIKNGISSLLIHIVINCSSEIKCKLQMDKIQKRIFEFVSKKEGSIEYPSIKKSGEMNVFSVVNSDERQYPKRPFVAGGALLVDNSRVLLVKRRFEPNKGSWTIPSGLVKSGETLRDATVREIYEESGLKIELGKVIEIIDVVVRDNKKNVKFHYVIIVKFLDTLH